MAKNAVVFSGRNGLDFSELRAGVLRIPEVTLRLRSAQEILDSMRSESMEGESWVGMQRIDLMATIAADDEHFFRNIKLKSLLAAIVQIGLFDRYLRTQKKPDFMLGNSNGDSAMLVCSGRMSFQEMVEKSQAIDTFKPADKVVPLHPPAAVQEMVELPAPLLSGLSLTEYNAMKAESQGEAKAPVYIDVPVGGMELRKIILSLYQDFEVTRFVSVGPASAMRGTDYRSLGAGEIESLDSIDLDPMLGWFWRSMRPQAVALAQ